MVVKYWQFISDACCIEIERFSDGQTLCRHPDDLKRFFIPPQPAAEKKLQPPNWWEILGTQHDDQTSDYSDFWYGNPPPHPFQPPVIVPDQAAPHPELDAQQEPRRSTRDKRAPERLGAQVYNDQQPLRGEDYIIPPWWPGYPREAN